MAQRGEEHIVTLLDPCLTLAYFLSVFNNNVLAKIYEDFNCQVLFKFEFYQSIFKFESKFLKSKIY